MIQSTKKIDRELLPHAFFSLSLIVVVEAALALSRGMETQILNYEAINGSDTLWTPTQTYQISISQSKRNNLILSKGLDFLTYHRIAFVFTPLLLWVKFLESAGRIEKLILGACLKDFTVMRALLLQSARARLFGLSAMRHGNLINTSRWVNHLSSSTDG
jgi:hypothetical protein